MRQLLAAAALAVGCVTPPTPAAAKPFTVEDLLQVETLGAAAFDPHGRHLVYEARGAYATASRFDSDRGVVHGLSRLRVVATDNPGPGRPLLAGDPAGVLLGDFSPSGDRLAVYRVIGPTWRLGVVTMSTGAVRWLPITPQGDTRGRALQWLDDRRLLVLDRPDGRGPLVLRQGSTFSRELTRRWEAAATGAGAHTAYGSGAYLGVRTRAANRLLLVDAQTGDRDVLAEGEFIDLDVSPQGDRVALLQSGEDLQPRGEAPVRGPAGSETEATRLSILDLRTGETRSPCAPCDVLPQVLAWSPSGRRLLVFTRGRHQLWTDGRLAEVNVQTGAVRVIGERVKPRFDLNPVSVWTAWMGETPLVFGRLAGAHTDRDDWFALGDGAPRNLTGRLPPPSRSARVAGRDHLWVWAGDRAWRVRRSGDVTAAAPGSSVAALPDRRVGAGGRLARAPAPALWVTAQDASGTPSLTGLGAEGQTAAALGAPAGGAWAAAAPGGVALQRATDAHGVETLTLSVGGRSIPTAAVNRGWEARDPPQIVQVRHPGPVGEPVVGWVFLPTGSPARFPAPLVVRAYPGAAYPAPPQETPGRPEFYQNIRVLTGHGYAVLVPSLPNPPGGMKEPAQGLAERILAIVQAAIDVPELADKLDPTRMAIMGHSFGGYSAMITVAQTDCFAAAVSLNGVSDLVGYWSTIPQHLQLDSELAYWSNWHTGVVERTQPEMGAPPWRDPARYIRNSPLFLADRIQTPLLLIHGAQDGLSAAQSEAMYSALFRQGKDALLLIYWGAMHAPSSPGDIRDVYDQTFRFLDARFARGPTGGVEPSANPGPASANSAPRPLSTPPRGCPRASPPRSDAQG